MNHEEIAADLIRVLRGRRSQMGLAKRLGYRSNVVYTWESGRGWPTAATALWAAERTGTNVRQAFVDFYRSTPPWLVEHDPASPEGVAAFLSDLRGSTSVVELAKRSGRNRYAVSRWLKGSTEPKLPEFLQMVEVCSLRLLDLLGKLSHPERMPSICAQWRELQVARNVAYDEPWAQAVLRALELESYAQLPKHRPGWIARAVGISEDDEERIVALLERTGQIAFDGRRYRTARVLTLDTRDNPEGARRLRAFWLSQGLARVEQGKRGFAYNLFSVSNKDLDRLRELQRAYFAEVRSVIAESEPAERVGLSMMQLFAFDDD